MKVLARLRPVMVLVFTASRLAAAPPTIVEQVLAPPWKPGTILTLSVRGMHVASTHATDSKKWVVTIDGVDGAEYDEILSTVPTIDTIYQENGLIQSQTITHRGPVAFSPDGTRYAYAARSGADVVVILDGKEHFRAPQSPSAPPVSLMQFTPDGRHLYFYNPTGDTLQSFRILMDGKPVTPAFDQIPQLMFSADGSRWLLNAGKAKQPNEKILVIDGKEPGYTGERPRFTPDGKKVVCTSGGRGEQKLLVDGQPILAAFTIERFKLAANGDVAAIVESQDKSKRDLYLNGKLVPGTGGVKDVIFSPDGKHWGASCATNMFSVWWVVLDGKRHPNYKAVHGLTFSPDSTRCAYSAQSDQGWQMVVNGEAGELNAIFRAGPWFAKTGNILVYTAGPMATKVYYNGTVSAPHHSVWGLELSPDGTHCAYYAGVDALSTDFTVDGEAKSRGGSYDVAQRIIFSPDSKHLAATARRPKGGATIYIDGYFFPERLNTGSPQEFTPDNQHLVLFSPGTDENRMAVKNYYLDGQLAAHFSSRNMTWANSPKMVRRVVGVMQWGVNSNPPDPDAKDWEFEPDGSILFIGAAPGPNGYGPVKRIKVTPASDTTFTTWVSHVRADEAAAKPPPR